MEEKSYIEQFEAKIADSVYNYLLKCKEADEIKPDAPDMNVRWPIVCQSYLQDGIREFSGYPTVSLGWMMLTGMAITKFWDKDWEKYSKVEDLYTMLRDVRGYDCMDDYICEDILKLSPKGCKELKKLVENTATIALRGLQYEHFEPGTPLAFQAYVATLHQMYYAGVAVELRRLGYHMQKL